MLRSPWTTWTHGRRCALLGASAAVVVCLGGVLAGCGGDGGGDGYVATGAAGGPPRLSGTAVLPTGEVTLVPLDGPAGGGGRGDDRGGGAGTSPGRNVSQATVTPSPVETERSGQPVGEASEPAATPT